MCADSPGSQSLATLFFFTALALPRAGALEDNKVFHLAVAPPPAPPAPVCIAICFDAFYTDVVAHLDAQGCRLLLQPSYNDGPWAAYTEPGGLVWQAQDWLRGAVTDVQAVNSTNVTVVANSMVTGNFFSLAVDGQSGVFRRSAHPYNATVPPLLYAGVDAAVVGTLYADVMALAPWAIEADPSLPLPQRRALLQARAEAMAPGSGSPYENGYVGAVLSARIEL